jgi:muramidase (phage lysozyme)
MHMTLSFAGEMKMTLRQVAKVRTSLTCIGVDNKNRFLHEIHIMIYVVLFW